MKRSIKRNKTKTVARAEARGALTHRPNLSAGKKILFAVVTSGGFFLLLEIVLALAGVKPVLYQDDPYVGFVSTIPLFVEESGPDGRVHMVTARNKLQWFNSQRFPKEKERGSFRIFTLGGSTTYGRPYDDTASFGGWLRELLPAADPSRVWEVINAGGISYASYRSAIVMEELVRYQPDLFIVYSGHNEFLEERTYRSIMETPKVVTAAGAVMSRTRIYAAVKTVIEAAWPPPTDRKEGPAILQSEVDTILERSMGPSAYTRNDTLREQKIAHYRFNLDRMVDIARSVGADLVFVTPAANLKDCSPFKSEHLSGLNREDLQSFDDLLKRAENARAADVLDEALDVLEQAAAIDDRFAELHYLRGQVLYDMKRYHEAKSALQRAVDEDICPLRAPASIQQIVAEIGERRDVPVVDFARIIEGRSEHGIPGSDHFLDHVHLPVEGYRLLALELLETLHDEDIVDLDADWGAAKVEAVSRAVESRIDERAHGVALRNLAKVFAWAGKFDEAEKLGTRAAESLREDAESYNTLGLSAAAHGDYDEAMRHYRHALRIKPDYTDAHNNLGIALVFQERFGDAIVHFREALQIEPNDETLHHNLANAAKSQGDLDEAIRHYRQVLQIDGSDADAHSNLGITLMAQGKVDAATAHFQQALEARPDSAEAHYNLGKALGDRGNLDGAIHHYREALRIQPDYAEAHHNLGTVLGPRGELDEAIRHFRAALQATPDFAEAHYNLANALLSQGMYEDAISHLRQALRAKPDYTEAMTNLGFVQSSQGKYDEALAHFRRVLELRPRYPKAHHNLGGVLALQGRLDEAIGYYRRAVELEPDFADGHYNLANVLAAVGRWDEALQHYRRAAQLEPDWPKPLRGMAWAFATHPDPQVRDAAQAIQLAERAAALTEYRDAAVLDALAASYASAGQFDRAVETARRGLSLPSAAEADPLAREIRSRLELYQQGKPYRQPARAAGAMRSR